jgi:hypothetical protein
MEQEKEINKVFDEMEVGIKKAIDRGFKKTTRIVIVGVLIYLSVYYAALYFIFE